MIGSLYRPPNSKNEYSNKLSVAIKNLAMKYQGSVIHVLIGGDANLPDIERETLSKASSNNLKQLNSILITTVFQISGEQVVDFSTRRYIRHIPNIDY
jgi:hypothetical protein